MRIIKAETEGFEDYEVLAQVPRTLFGYSLPWKISLELKNVLDVDDKTGRVVIHVTTLEGHPVYTNGTEDIYLDNSVKMLMLIPGVVKSFLEAGFRPKTIIRYEPELKITNKNPRPVVVTEQVTSEANA